jgi:hypothetical protein
MALYTADSLCWGPPMDSLSLSLSKHESSQNSHTSANTFFQPSPPPPISLPMLWVYACAGNGVGEGPKLTPLLLFPDLCLYVHWVCPVLAKAVGGGGWVPGVGLFLSLHCPFNQSLWMILPGVPLTGLCLWLLPTHSNQFCASMYVSSFTYLSSKSQH